MTKRSYWLNLVTSSARPKADGRTPSPLAGNRHSISGPIAILPRDQSAAVSIGRAVVAFMRSIENFEVTFRQAKRCVKSR